MRDYTLLLIDYEPMSIEQVTTPLLKAGFRVEVAHDGVSGLEAFRRLRPELVLIEAMIPKKHGFEVCQEIKKSSQGKHTRVVILTSVYKGRKYRTQAIHLYGCDEYLEKPVSDERLVTVCRRFLGDPAGAAEQQRKTGTDGTRLAAAPRLPVADPTMSPPAGRMPIADLTEDEIMATLDAILPGGDTSTAGTAPEKDTPVASAAAEQAAPETEPEQAAEGPSEGDVAEPDTAAEAEPSGGNRVISFDAARARKHREDGNKEEAAKVGEAAEEPSRDAAPQADEVTEPLEKMEEEAGGEPAEEPGTAEAAAEDAPLEISEDIAEAELDAALDAALSKRGEVSTPLEEENERQQPPAEFVEPEPDLEPAEAAEDAPEEAEEMQPEVRPRIPAAAALESPAASEASTDLETAGPVSLTVTDHRGLPGWVWPAAIAGAAVLILGLVFLMPRDRSETAAPAPAVAQGAPETPLPVTPGAEETPAPDRALTPSEEERIAPSGAPAARGFVPNAAAAPTAATPMPVKGAPVEKTSGNRVEPRGSKLGRKAPAATAPSVALTSTPPRKEPVVVARKPLPLRTATPPVPNTAGPAVTKRSSGPENRLAEQTPPAPGLEGVTSEKVETTERSREEAPAATPPATMTSTSQAIGSTAPPAGTSPGTAEKTAPPVVESSPTPKVPEPRSSVPVVPVPQPTPAPVPRQPVRQRTVPEKLTPAPAPAPPAPKPIRRGDLVDLAEVDGPPKPIRRDLPVYPMRARQLRQEGSVLLRILINENGKVTDVKLIRGIEGSDLNEAAIQAARKWTFRPAVKRGVAVKVWKLEKIVFKL